MDYQAASIDLHRKWQGKLETVSLVPVNNREDLSLAYSPGVAGPCLAIAKDKSLARELTLKGRTVAVISDGSAVLGLGNIGAEAALPVMEGKCVLFKAFAGLDAFPIVLNTQNTEEIIAAVKAIAPTFGAINLEDISAPRCFEIEERLKAELDIPVMHDDQHGTAIVVLAGLINSLKIIGKAKEDLHVVVNGVGAAGVAITKLLLLWGVKNITVVDSAGTIYQGREGLNPVKAALAEVTNTACQLDANHPDCRRGGLAEAIVGADVFVGVSVWGALTEDMVKSMASDAIIFALANPTPEIMPELAKAAGARIIATGRSDYPNQINNVLAYPGIFRGAIDNQVARITDAHKIAAAEGLAAAVANPTEDKIIPGPFDAGIVETVAKNIV